MGGGNTSNAFFIHDVVVSITLRITEYVTDLRESQPQAPLKITTELRDGPCMHEGTLSARIYLKQANEHNTVLLTKIAEPISSCAWLIDGNDRKPFLDLAWKYLLQNHPHDSICGCSIDQVHQDMMHRFKQCELICSDITNSALDNLSDHIDTSGISQDAHAVVVFNTLSKSRDDLVETTIALPCDNQADNYTLTDVSTGQTVEFSLTSNGPTKSLKLHPNLTPQVQHSHIHSLTFIATDIPACGYKTYALTPAKTHAVATQQDSSDAYSLENTHIKVTINPNGTLNIRDKRTNRTNITTATPSKTEVNVAMNTTATIPKTTRSSPPKTPKPSSPSWKTTPSENLSESSPS